MPEFNLNLQEQIVTWDPNDINYYKKNLKDDAWADIGVAMHMTGSDCKQKMVNLLASFRQEKMKTKKIMGTGRGKGIVFIYMFIYNYIPFKELCMTMSLYSRIHSVSTVYVCSTENTMMYTYIPAHDPFFLFLCREGRIVRK
jgi:hypothetical protein